MNKENNKRLDDAFPGLFPYGVWCGDGWFDLIRDLAVEISRIARRDGLAVRAERVEEKYGWLRLDLNTQEPPPAIAQAIAVARERSARTCEVTGRPGVLCDNEHGWLKTLAPDVASERGFRPVDETTP